MSQEVDDKFRAARKSMLELRAAISVMKSSQGHIAWLLVRASDELLGIINLILHPEENK